MRGDGAKAFQRAKGWGFAVCVVVCKGSLGMLFVG